MSGLYETGIKREAYDNDAIDIARPEPCPRINTASKPNAMDISIRSLDVNAFLQYQSTAQGIIYELQLALQSSQHDIDCLAREVERLNEENASLKEENRNLKRADPKQES